MKHELLLDIGITGTNNSSWRIRSYMRGAGSFLLLFVLAHMALAQQRKPWDSKPCREHPGSCGILVTFNPPLKSPEGTALLVPNTVTVDVPLELHATRVVVSSYPLGTEVGDIPSEGFVEMRSSQKVGKYLRFRGEIKKCTDQDSLEVNVYCKGYERYPIDAGVGGAIECMEIRSTGADQPPPTK